MKEILTDKKTTVKEFISRAEGDTKVTVRLPNEVSVELVQANELRHYEVFTWLAGLLATLAAGFWNENIPSAIVFIILACLFFGMAIYYRRKVFSGSIEKSTFLKDLNKN